MIADEAFLRLNLLFGKRWYTNMFTSFCIHMSHTFILIALIAESIVNVRNDTRSLGMWSLKWKVLPNLVLFFNTFYNLPQLRAFSNDFFNLCQVFVDIEPRYRRTRAWGSTLFMTFLKHLQNFQGSHYFKNLWKKFYCAGFKLY